MGKLLSPDRQCSSESLAACIPCNGRLQDRIMLLHYSQYDWPLNINSVALFMRVSSTPAPGRIFFLRQCPVHMVLCMQGVVSIRSVGMFISWPNELSYYIFASAAHRTSPTVLIPTIRPPTTKVVSSIHTCLVPFLKPIVIPFGEDKVASSTHGCAATFSTHTRDISSLTISPL